MIWFIAGSVVYTAVFILGWYLSITDEFQKLKTSSRSRITVEDVWDRLDFWPTFAVATFWPVIVPVFGVVYGCEFIFERVKPIVLWRNGDWD